MDKLPPLPSKSSSDALAKPSGENAVKQPAGGARSEFPRLLAETPAARKVSGAGADQADGDAPSTLPPEADDGKELPPGQSPEPATTTATQAVGQEVALPPGLLWAQLPGMSGTSNPAAVEPETPEVSGALRFAAGAFSAAPEGLGVPEPEGPGQHPLPAAALGGGTPQAGALNANALNTNALNANALSTNALNSNGWQTAALDAQLPPGMELDALLNEKPGLDAAAPGVRLGLPTAAEALSVSRASPVAGAMSAGAMAAGAMEIPVGRPGWDHELGARVLWVVRDQLQHAELRLNPPNLGPLEVRLSLLADQSINLNFSASQLQTRDAVEAAIPRLREMLAETGVNLADVNVSSQSDWRSGGNPDFQRAGAKDQGGGAVTADDPVVTTIIRGQGLVDFFA